MTCNQSEKEIAGDEWTLVYLSGVSTEEFWTWEKTDTIGYDRNPYLAIDKCVKFERELWFELKKCMWRKNQSVYQYHMKYVCNDILKPFRVKILRYNENVRYMHELDKHPPPSSMKGESAMADNR